MPKCAAFVVCSLIAYAWAQQRYCSSISDSTCGTQARLGCSEITSTITATSGSACEQQCQSSSTCWYFEFVAIAGAPSTCTLYADAGGCAGCAAPVANQQGSETGYCNAPCMSVQPGESTQSACNDNNNCTVDSCNFATGGCTNTPVVCNNGNGCSIGECNPYNGNCSYFFRECYQSTVERCVNNVCVEETGNCTGFPVDCDDGNPCTIDTCNNSTGCEHSEVACASNINSCTINSCNATTGTCQPSQPRVCVDGNPCTFDTCVEGKGCQYPPMCNAGNNCTTDTCNPNTGACTLEAVDCDDDLACTADSCSLSTGCVHTELCNDNNACTIDTCTANGCVHQPVLCLNARGSCTLNSCSATTGTCVGTPKNCNDNNACTTDTCSLGQCINTDNCVPKDNCTYTTCNVDDGACNAYPIYCNDGNACTIDTCNPATGCVYTPNCNDNNACTNDACGSNGVCTHTPKLCLSIFGSCSSSSCNPTTGGCVSTQMVCDSTTQCYNPASGVCTPHIGSGAATCSYTPYPSGTACNDGNSRTINDHCDGSGNCVGTTIIVKLSDKFHAQAADAEGSTITTGSVLAYGGTIIALLAVIAAVALYLSRQYTRGVVHHVEEQAPIYEWQL